MSCEIKNPTNNPLCSNSFKDLEDNVKNLDFAVNSRTSDYWIDRLGETRLTVAGALKLGTAQAYLTQAEMNADSNQPDGTWAVVVNDTAGNSGYYIRESGAWVKSSLQPSSVDVTNSLQQAINSLEQTKADIASPQFTGIPRSPSAGLSYETVLQIANLSTVFELTRNFRSIAISNEGITLTTEQSRMPVIAFTGALTTDVIVEVPTDARGITRTFRNATTGNRRVTVRHVGQTVGVNIEAGEIVCTISNGSSVFRIGVSDSRIAEIETAITDLEEADLDVGVEQIKYVGIYNTLQKYKKGEAVKYNDSYFYADNLRTTTINYIKNPLFNLGKKGWQTAGTSAVQIGDGVWRYILNTDKASGALLLSQTSVHNIPTEAGETWSSSVSIENHSQADFSVRLGLFFANSKTVYGNDTIIPAGSKVTVKLEGIDATSGSTAVRMTVNNISGSIITSGTEITFSEPIITKGDLVQDYFDGSFDSVSDTRFSWEGTANDSYSLKTIDVDYDYLETPGVDPRWIRYLSDLPSGGGVVATIGEYTPTITEKPTTQIACFLTRDRTIGFNFGSSQLNMTYDDGETWELLHNFSGSQTNIVRELANGELLVTTQGNGKSKAWISSGFRKGGEVVWTETLESHSKYARWVPSWGIFDDDNLVVMIDYGSKAGMNNVPDGENARYAYLSLDYGKTWKTIFDLNEWAISNGYGTLDENGVPQARGFHCHGIAYDKWWDRIWITFGDNTTVSSINSCGGTCYSDDFGKTWKAANWGKDSVHLSPTGSRHQNVGIWPMEDCILFGTDSAPNGVQRIERSQGKHIEGEYTINIAYAYSEETGLTHLCQGIYQAINIPNQPVFFAFGAEGAIRKSFIVATRDGFDFKLIWESPEDNARGMGLRLIAGPTRQGNLVSRITDNIDGVTKSFSVVGKAPIY